MPCFFFVNSTNPLELRESPDYEPEDEEALQDEEFSDDQFLADVTDTYLGLCYLVHPL
jgi:hypothetical protein